MRKRSWSRRDDSPQTTSKAIIQRKVMLSVWWDFKGVVFELLPRNQTINSNVYYRQLDSLNPSSRNVQSSLIVKELCSITTTRDHTQVLSPVKNYWSLDGMCCHTHYTGLTLRRHSTCFALFKNPCVV